VSHGSPDGPESFVWQNWEIVGIPARLDGDGHVVGDLGRQWLVMVGALWNDEFRGRFAKANEIESFDDPGMGDINKMRNDIVHHGAVATSRNTGRCEVFRWFRVGETIHPMAVHVAEFMRHLRQVHGTAEIAGDEPWRIQDSFELRLRVRLAGPCSPGVAPRKAGGAAALVLHRVDNGRSIRAVSERAAPSLTR